MKKQTMALTVLLLSLSAIQAKADCSSRDWDNCDLATTYTGLTTFGPTAMTQVSTENISGKHHKLIVAAQEDAKAFIASEGKIYGVQLAAAVEVLRADLPHLAQVNDMQIAQAILAQ